eukprot:TRINITY_DN6646_c2_g1_i2.p2 TRINITY_DN6646_c2_g1~~TRINITY_DN6646_c2_g1_i2.p2  ORF type:complete len:158 (+),score=38.16 TRINITY_DN6646_c2_g1_i2:196-669(+)
MFPIPPALGSAGGHHALQNTHATHTGERQPLFSTMEVFLQDRRCGEKYAVHIGEDDTLMHLKAEAREVVFECAEDVLPEDVLLELDGVVLDDSTSLSGAGVSQGCCIEVGLSGVRFVEDLQEAMSAGEVYSTKTIPDWARRMCDVVLAMVECDKAAL